MVVFFYFFCIVGVHYVFDTTFSREFSLIESSREFVRRYQNREVSKTALPMLTSACPGIITPITKLCLICIFTGQSNHFSNHCERLVRNGVTRMLEFVGWVCYAEKTHGSFILPYISTTKSPQQVMGSLVKDYFAKIHNK